MMKPFKSLLFLFIIFINIAHGQDNNDPKNTEPLYPKYKIYNRNLKTYWMKEPAFCEAAKKIETLPLRCDTINHNQYLYFDNKDRLRKYWTHYSFSDGSHEYLELRAYYDTVGELIYLDYSCGSNCEDACGYFVMKDRKITDSEMNEACGCCEDDTIPSTKSLPPGVKIPRKISWWDSSAFYNTTTLLEVLSVYKYKDIFNLEFLGKEEVFAMITDENINQKFQENTITLDEKGWNTITTWLDKEGHILKCEINDSSQKHGEFTKLYYDTNDNLYLIRYDYVKTISEKDKNRESFTFYIESEMITGGDYYRDFDFDKNSDVIYHKCDSILQGLINSRLSKSPYLKKDLTWMLNTDKLQKKLSSLKR